MNPTADTPSLAERLAGEGPHLRPADREAREIMTPGVVCLPVTASLARAGEAMAAHGVHAILAVSCEGRPVGWVTAARLLDRAVRSRRLDWAVDAIGEPVVAIKPTGSAAAAVELMRETGAGRLAVQERPELMPEGVISDLDVAAFVGRSVRA